MDRLRVGIIGSKFIASIHAEALARVPNAEVRAVCSTTEAGARAFAEQHGIPHWRVGYGDLLARDDIDMVTVCVPNDLHRDVVVAAARAGKHVVCEKPLCLTLDQADEMIAACRDAGVKLMYAEELCFAPKYVRMKQLVDEGALGAIHCVKQSEKHDGPHAAWFWDVGRSGGGVTMDMGCHAIEFFRWMLGKPRVASVYAEMGTRVHGAKTKGDDHSVIIVTFEGGVTCIAEESWCKKGGMDDRAEVHGSEGVCYANLLQGNSLLTYSDVGYGYAIEKAGKTQGWSFTMYEEAWNYGFPQELSHYTDCVLNDTQPLETGEDGREVLRMIFAAYESARTGQRVDFPWDPPAWAHSPIHCWKPWLSPDCLEGLRQDAG